MKIITIVGARPQFVKAAVFSRSIEHSNDIDEIIVHTGQHYDNNMSELFFDEMQIKKPKYNLGIGAKTHGAMTGQMLSEIENIYLEEKPDYVLVYGDTNSTLAGALAASKIHIPVAHVEAGLRSFNMAMPEEQNRILTDHISTNLFCPTDLAVKNLANEGITKGVDQVGDIMYEGFEFYKNSIDIEYEFNKVLEANNVSVKNLKGDYNLLTIHRAENTDSEVILRELFDSFKESGKNYIYPIHPRTKNKLKEFNIEIPKNVITIQPVGYFSMIALLHFSSMVVTDSGGLQKEAYFSHKPCITLREQTEWKETVKCGWNEIVGTSKPKILEALSRERIELNHGPLYGAGNTSDLIKKIIIS